MIETAIEDVRVMERLKLVERLREGTYCTEVSKTDVFLNVIMSQAADEIEFLRAFLEWQPIETAPRDGTPIDCYGPEVGRLVDVYWNEGCVCWSSGLSDGDLTHWRPSPLPPRKRGDDDDLPTCDGCGEKRPDVRMVSSSWGDTDQCEDCAP